MQTSARSYNPAADPAVRRTMIGATDGAAIIGVSSWRTAGDVYLEIIGAKLPEDIDSQEQIIIGRLLEDDVAQMYEQETGRTLVPSSGTQRHPVHDFIACHPDYHVHGETGLVECKTAGISAPQSRDARMEWGAEGSDQIPRQYLVQCHHQMLVTGARWVDLAALIGGRGLVIHRVERDEEFLTWYEGELVKFWREHIERRVPPEPRTVGDCSILYRQDSGTTVQGTPDTLLHWRELLACRARAKAAEADAEVHEIAIKAFMGDAAVLEIDGQVAATWKSDKQGRIDTAALKRAHPDIAAQFTKAPSRRFLPKEAK